MSHYTESFNRLVMNTRTNKKEPLGSFFIGRIDMILMCSIFQSKEIALGDVCDRIASLG